MKVRVSYSSTVLGDGVFFEGEVGAEPLRNVVADMLARKTAKDGKVHSAGMWLSEPVPPAAPTNLRVQPSQ